MPTRWINVRAVSSWAVLGVSWCLVGHYSGCAKAPAANKERPIPQVSIVEVAEFTTLDNDEYVGRLEASETVEIHSRVFGYLKTVDFQDGAYVQKDQTLYTIEADEYQAVHQQAISKIAVWESKLDLAKTKLARNEKLLKSGATTREEYDEAVAAEREATASVVAAKADADRTAIDLKYTVIQSPLTGRIDRTLLTQGNLVTGGAGTGTALTRIVKIDPIYAYFDVDERSLLRYQSAKPAAGATPPSETPPADTPQSLREKAIPCRIQLADETDFPHAGMLDFSENRLNSGTGTIRVRGVFTNPSRRLTPGMFVRVRVPVSQEYSALMVPETAIGSDQSLKYVYVVTGENVVERRDVDLGGQRGSWRIVRSGLKATDRVIVKGQQRVRPEQKVEAQLAKLEPPVASK